MFAANAMPFGYGALVFRRFFIEPQRIVIGARSRWMELAPIPSAVFDIFVDQTLYVGFEQTAQFGICLALIFRACTDAESSQFFTRWIHQDTASPITSHCYPLTQIYAS